MRSLLAATREKPPLTATRESLHTAMKAYRAVKKKKKKETKTNRQKPPKITEKKKLLKRKTDALTFMSRVLVVYLYKKQSVSIQQSFPQTILPRFVIDFETNSRIESKL